jgi:hypothetical protein
MPPAIQAIIDARAEIEREVDELLRQLEARQELLAAAARFEIDEQGELVVSGGERGTPAARKRELILGIMRERPGEWTTREVRDVLAEHGIDPEAGTPVKNILWNFAKEGYVEAKGNGVYELSAPTVGAEHDQPEVLAA